MIPADTDSADLRPSIIRADQGLSWDFNLGELENDVEFASKCNNLVVHLKKVEGVVNKLLPIRQNYDKLPQNQQVEIDLFLMYTLNSLWWINLRLTGVDLTNHPVKQEFQRIKALMVKWKETKDRSLRPKVDVEAAKRFVRSGLYDHKKETNEAPPNKKIRFEDSD